MKGWKTLTYNILRGIVDTGIIAFLVQSWLIPHTLPR